MTSPRSALRAELLDETIAPRTALAESPRWAAGQWWWLDADDGRIWTAPDLDSPSVLLAELGRRVSLVQPAGPELAVIADGAMLRALRRTASGWELGEVRDLGLGEGWVLNDGCADAAGRLWVGAVSPEHGPEGTLLRIDPDRVVTMRDGVLASNGMAWSADGATLFHVDTGRAQLLAYRVDAQTGDLRETEVVRQWDEGLPDGVAIDVEGGVWVALYGTGEVWRLLDGALDQVIEVPTPQVTSVALGGADGCDILITTAREGFTAEDSANDPLAGRLFRARWRVPGIRTPLVGRNAWTR